jgi:hypothetical protein
MKIDPATMRWSKENTKRDKKRYDETGCLFHWTYNGDNKLRGKRSSAIPVSLIALLTRNSGAMMGARLSLVFRWFHISC